MTASDQPDRPPGFVRRVRDGAGKVAAFWVNKENIEASLKKNFDEAKAISDFVGMIVRFGFALAASIYFGKRLKDIPSPSFESYAFGFCWVMSIGLTVALASGIMSIIFAYEMRAVGRSVRPTTRLIFFALAVLSTGCLWYGINDLAGILASTFSPPKK